MNLHIRNSCSPDLLTLRVLDVLGQQEHEVCDHGAGEDQLQREDGVHLADEPTPDRLVPEVETRGGLGKYFSQLCFNAVFRIYDRIYDLENRLLTTRSG